MSEPQHERPEPYNRPPPRKAGSDPGRQTLIGVVLAAAVIAGSLALFNGGGTAPAVPAPAAPPAIASAPVPVPAPAAPARAPVAPAAAPAKAPACPTYEQYVLDTKSPAVSEQRLIEEAACLCSLARGYVVRVPPGGLQQYKVMTACPAGTTVMPMDREAKQWKGEWIDEPGHSACICSTSVREFRPAMIAQ